MRLRVTIVYRSRVAKFRLRLGLQLHDETAFMSLNKKKKLPIQAQGAILPNKQK